jgi:hypothetical protein
VLGLDLDAADGFVLGGLAFLVGSYVMHCKYKLGPWPCQNLERRCPTAPPPVAAVPPA